LAKEAGVFGAEGPDAALFGVADKDVAGVVAECGGEAEGVAGVEVEGFLAVEDAEVNDASPAKMVTIAALRKQRPLVMRRAREAPAQR